MNLIEDKKKQFTLLINQYETVLNIYTNDYLEFKCECESDQTLELTAADKIEAFELLYEALTVINEAGRNQIILNELKNILEKKGSTAEFDLEHFESTLTSISCNMKLLKFIDSHISKKIKRYRHKIKSFQLRKEKSALLKRSNS
jgi:hypothetical protein